MKKYYLLGLCVVIILITGCGKKEVICSKSEKKEGIEMSSEITVLFDNNDKVSDASITYGFSDKKLAETMCNSYKRYIEESKIACEDTKITISGINSMDDENEDSKDLIGKNKDKFIKEMTASGYSCK